jgi:two-component system, NtrC family, sensor histidine kinase HydH
VRKWTILVVAAVSVVLIGGGAVVGWRARRDRAALFARFAEDRQRRLDETAVKIAGDLASVAETVGALTRALSTVSSADGRQLQLGAALAVVKPYLLIEVHDAAGERVLSVTGPRAGPDFRPAAFRAAMAQTAGRAVPLAPGTLVVSPPLAGDPRGWFRILAVALPRGAAGQPTGALTVLVDIEPLFAPLRPMAAAPGSHLLVLGPSGIPLPLSSGALLHRTAEADLERAPRWLRTLVTDMRAGRRGAVPITGGDSLSAGLGPDPLVAAYAPIPAIAGAHWSIATFSSTAPLRAGERIAMLRLGVTSGVLAVCLVGLGGLILYSSRRAVTLRERLRHAAEIEYLHEKTQKILDNIPTGVLALSEAGVTMAANRVLRERMPATAVGAPLDQAFPEAPSATIRRLRKLIEQTRESSRVQSLFGERLALFGEEETYNIHVVPLEPRLQDTRFLLVIEDLSEVRALESQLLRAEKLATVGVLAAGIAHEIGTPMGVVRGRAEYVLGKLGADHPQARGVQVIIEQIDHVTGTLRQLLDFARVKPAAVRSVAVAAAVRTVVELLRLEAQRRKVSTIHEVPETLPEVAADPDQLQQVLVNLVMNAYDACAPGGRVNIRARAEEVTAPAGLLRVRLEIVDDGCGIPEENRHQVFDPFFTTKKRGTGTGLGLAIAAQIVRNHGGEIELESEPGRGTCVTLLWPTAPVEEPHGKVA